MERNFILGAIVVVAVAMATAVTLTNDHARDASGNVDTIENAPAPASTAMTGKSQRQPSSPIEERRDDALLAHVEYKYRYLLADVESAHVDELKRRLLAREGEENLVRKATTDVHVSEMLSPREREYYEAL
jgi:hypothetical protein